MWDVMEDGPVEAHSICTGLASRDDSFDHVSSLDETRQIQEVPSQL